MTYNYPPGTKLKQCRECRQFKLLGNFYKLAHGGFHPDCRFCTAKLAREKRRRKRREGE